MKSKQPIMITEKLTNHQKKAVIELTNLGHSRDEIAMRFPRKVRSRIKAFASKLQKMKKVIGSDIPFKPHITVGDCKDLERNYVEQIVEML